MAKTLTARGTDGLVSIHEAGANIDDPTSNLEKIYFHSHLDYLSILSVHGVTVRSNQFGLTELFSHNLGRPAMYIAVNRITGDILGGTTVLYSAARYLSAFHLASDNNKIYASFFGSKPPDGTISLNVTLPLRIYILENTV